MEPSTTITLILVISIAAIGLLTWLAYRYGEDSPEYGRIGKNEFESREPGEARVFETGGGWGNKIKFMDYMQGSKIQTIVGWKPTRPRDGDLLVAEMQSGKECVFGIYDVKRETNPPDMFFAKVIFLDYKERFEPKEFFAENPLPTQPYFRL